MSFLSIVRSIFPGRALWVLLPALLVVTAAPLFGGHSSDQPPAETTPDPGDVFLPSGVLEVDDGPCPDPPPAPCLGVPIPDDFDLDGYTLEEPRLVCPADPPHLPGMLFSFDDGDPGAGHGMPDNPEEIYFYDRCGVLGGGSFHQGAIESLFALGTDPPPRALDDDIDAYETRPMTEPDWAAGFAILFTPDEDAPGGLPIDPACPGANAGASIYSTDAGSPLAAIELMPCDLGLPLLANCDIDALATVIGEPHYPDANRQILFSTDDQRNCGLDPGDIYISDGLGSHMLWADDVTQLRIAVDERDPVDLDALSVNDVGPFQPGNPYVPTAPPVWKSEWPDYAPSGMPDFSQDHATFPMAPLGGTTFCGPTAVANCFSWFDSKFEGVCSGGTPGDGLDRHGLVTDYGVGDDHSVLNVEPLIWDLAACMQTDATGPGTLFSFMEACIDDWLTVRDLQWGYELTSAPGPTFDLIGCEVERSENVILLLGFWWWNGAQWVRCGGHYVTAAGVHIVRDPGPDGLPGDAQIDDDLDGVIDELDELCPCGPMGTVEYGDDLCAGPGSLLAISDPGLNNAEAPVLGPGQIRGLSHGDHAPAVTPPPDHDDAANLSHDLYTVAPSTTGVSSTAIWGYGMELPAELVPCEQILRWCGQNQFEEGSPMLECGPGDLVSVEIEAALFLSPRVTDICIDVQVGLGDLLVHKGPCPSPASHAVHFDYIRGEVCQLSEQTFSIDLGNVECLWFDTPGDQQLDVVTADISTPAGVYFYLVRNVGDPDYGPGNNGKPRVPNSGDCP